MTLELALVVLAAFLALVNLGGGLYEVSVLDPAWPANPALIRPSIGGVSRRRFWIPAHGALEIALIAALIVCWGHADARVWLLVALASHVAMRAWSLIDFVPKAVAFERPDTATGPAAERWVARSRLRLPLDVVKGGALLAALVLLARAA